MNLGEAQEKAVKLLRSLHPKHDLGWHELCLTCCEIDRIEEAFEVDYEPMLGGTVTGLQPLTPEQIKMVEEFQRKMEAEVIPELIAKRRGLC